MAAWGFGNFENDDALDWTADLIDIGEELIPEAFARVKEAVDDYLEADLCSFALAAAEVVAAMNGKPSADLPEEVTEWLTGRPAPAADLLSSARSAVLAIFRSSELRDVWKQQEQLEEWEPRVQDLSRRLG
ncbi:MAG: DUF4259 domain-containing protein [Phycisphaerales bacterium]